MNQIQIDCFIAAALNGSLTTAAKSLFLSTQVVSQHIQKLEAELGHILFTRTKKGVLLTDYGQDFFNLASQWSILYTDTLRKIDEAYNEMASSLNIGLCEYIDYMGEISDSLLSFSEFHDNVVIKGNHFKSSDLLKLIEEGVLDVAIMPDSQIVSGGDFEAVPFAKEDLHLFISGPVADKKKTVIGSKQLDEICRNLPQLNTSYGVWTDKEWAEISARMSSSQKYKPRMLYELPNFRSVIQSLHFFPAVAVCDKRFGYKVDEDIYNTPVMTESWLCCVWYKRNENRLIHEFAEHMLSYYPDTKNQ